VSGPREHAVRQALSGRAGAAALFLVLFALAGCSGGAMAGKGKDRAPLTLPAADSFKSGACRDAADPILALGKFSYDHADATQLTVAERAELVDNGNKLLALREKAEPAVAERMSELLTSIGFVRIKVGTTYEPRFLQDMEAARMKLQNACTQ
jgi:hypothetical protein